MKDNKEIKNTLLKLGVTPDYLGYHYLAEAIDIVKKRFGKGEFYIKFYQLYVELGKKFNVSASSVERAMRHAICRSFEQPNAFHSRVFNMQPTSGAPTVSAFVAVVAEHLRMGE